MAGCGARGAHSGQELRQARKSGSSKSFQLVTDVKKLWEQARVKELKKAARTPLVDQIVAHITGKVHDVCAAVAGCAK